jgi:hypothetical protein
MNDLLSRWQMATKRPCLGAPFGGARGRPIPRGDELNGNPSHATSEAYSTFRFARGVLMAFWNRLIASIMVSWISGHFDSSLLYPPTVTG